MSAHGGPNRGQGRKPAYDDTPMCVYSMKLTAKQARQARKIGGGNLSAGVRKLIDGAEGAKV